MCCVKEENMSKHDSPSIQPTDRNERRRQKEPERLVLTGIPHVAGKTHTHTHIYKFGTSASLKD